MSQIEELERRIMSALDRIGQGLDGLPGEGGADAGEVEALRKELEDEKLASAQLEERVRALSARQKERSAADEEKSASMRKLDGELQSLRKANQQLRENNKALREAVLKA